MRVGVAADSTGDVAALCKAFRLLKGILGCQRLFFLGGHWEDVDGYLRATAAETALLPPKPDLAVEDLFLEAVVRVAEKGVGAPEDEKLLEMLGNSLCLLVHNKADLTKDDLTNASIILHGKSAKGAMVKIGSRAFITPGSVGGASPSVAVLTHDPPEISVDFYNLDGKVLAKDTAMMGSGTRFSVR